MHGPPLRPIHPERVAIYIRWSTEDQGEGTTLAVQRDACTSYVRSQGWSVNPALVFVDDGWSGAVLDRPGLTRLRAAVDAGAVDCVVVYKLDRLSRSVRDMVNLVCGEWEHRCHLKSAREALDTATHAGRMFFYTLTSFAEWERNVIRERTFAGKLRRAQEGRNPGILPPFGYRRRPGGAWEPDPATAPLVGRIFRRYLAGAGCRAIAAELNRDGIAAPAGGHWSSATVSKMLRNPAYGGRLVYGRESVSGPGNRRVRRPAPLVDRAGALPALVAAADWDRVQAVRSARPAVGRRQAGARAHASPHLLTGLLRCRCGHAYAATVTAPGRRYRYYTCLGRRDRGPACCGGGAIRQELLDAAVAAAFRHLYDSPAVRAALANRIRRELNAELRHLSVQDRRARRAAARLSEEERRLRRRLRREELAVTEYRELRADVQRELAAVRARQETGRRRLAALRALLESQPGLPSLLANVDPWDGLDAAGRKALLRLLVAELTAYRDARRGAVELALTLRVRPADPCPSPSAVTRAVTAAWARMAGAARPRRQPRKPNRLRAEP